MKSFAIFLVSLALVVYTESRATGESSEDQSDQADLIIQVQAQKVVEPPAPDSNTDITLRELKSTLESLIKSLHELKMHASQSLSAQSTVNKVVSSTSLESTSGTTSEYIVLPRSNLISAFNGQCLLPGDVVVVQANNGDALLGVIQDLFSPVTFRFSTLAELSGKFVTANRFFTVPQNDFSMQDRSLFDAVLKSASPRCDKNN